MKQKKFQGFIPLIRNSDQTEFSLVTMISKRNKTLSELTLGRRCISRMRGFLCPARVNAAMLLTFGWLIWVKKIGAIVDVV